MKQEAKILTATKDLVDRLLAMNTKNRKVRKTHVEYLAKQISDGNWSLTSQGVGVSVAGTLTNGQHRLEAIKAAGYPPVPLLVVYGLPSDCIKHEDTGLLTRSMSDVMSLVFDEKKSDKVIAVARALLREKTGNWCGKTAPDEIIETLEDYGSSIDALVSIPGSKSLQSPVMAAMVRFHEDYPETVEKFAHDVINGDMLSAGDPALTLRNWLFGRNPNYGGSAKVQRERFWKTANALFARIQNRSLSKLYATEVNF